MIEFIEVVGISLVAIAFLGGSIFLFIWALDRFFGPKE